MISFVFLKQIKERKTMDPEILKILLLDVQGISKIVAEKKTASEKLEALYHILRGFNNVIARMEDVFVLPLSYYKKRRELLGDDDEITMMLNTMIDSVMKAKLMRRGIAAISKGEKVKLKKDDQDNSIKFINKNTKVNINTEDNTEMEFEEADRTAVQIELDRQLDNLKKIRDYVRNDIEILKQNLLVESKQGLENTEIVSTENVDDLIWWKGTEGQLIYLYENLVKNKLIDNSQNDRRYLLLSKHFKNKNGKRFISKQMSQAAQNLVLNKERKPKKAEIIDKVIRGVKRAE